MTPADAVRCRICGSTAVRPWIEKRAYHIHRCRRCGNAFVPNVAVPENLESLYTAAYFGGRLYGRRPLAPRISPNKTVEGLVAGVLGGTLAFWFAGLYQDWLSGPDALLIGLAVALAAPVGDLFESLVKRDLAVKDTGSFFGAQLPAFREGLAEFQSGYAARHGDGAPVSAAPEAQQIAWLHEVDATPFFAAVRRLTVLGLPAMPKYGGHHDGAGWKLLGFVDGHFWEPPIGYYDQDYAGFVPYPGTQPYTA